ncbi:hypothetical protein [Bacillus cereus]|uniref:hypothetical protein n=1 Tax=Bacillus cereus TaxID=1396 RepID=UPI000935BC5F|nr:hypothetical protein [Bacillus cereus]OKA29671.1 hypothetical protein BJR05_09210 [Bacillus cereus]
MRCKFNSKLPHQKNEFSEYKSYFSFFYDIIYIKVDGGDINKQSFAKNIKKKCIGYKMLDIIDQIAYWTGARYEDSVEIKKYAKVYGE